MRQVILQMQQQQPRCLNPMEAKSPKAAKSNVKTRKTKSAESENATSLLCWMPMLSLIGNLSEPLSITINVSLNKILVWAMIMWIFAFSRMRSNRLS